MWDYLSGDCTPTWDERCKDVCLEIWVQNEIQDVRRFAQRSHFKISLIWEMRYDTVCQRISFLNELWNMRYDIAYPEISHQHQMSYMSCLCQEISHPIWSEIWECLPPEISLGIILVGQLSQIQIRYEIGNMRLLDTASRFNSRHVICQAISHFTS